MALMTVEREPEVARFIDSYKYDQDMANRRDRYGGGTSLPLNSDGYEDKQKVLREERHKDWLIQQDKQRQMEQQKMDQRRHRSPPRPAQPAGPQVDYNIQSEQARAEERKAYQDYMKAKEERYWAMRGRPVTPPGGLNIGNYDRQLKETAAAKKKEYKEMLDQQQREHMYLRARQEPEISVLDRNAQPSNYLANKPPPGPGYSRAREEAFKNDSQSHPIPERPSYGQPPYPGEGAQLNDHQGQRSYLEPMERSRSPQNQLPRSPEKPLDPDWLRVPLRDDERPHELGTPLAFKTTSHPQPLLDQPYSAPAYAQEGRKYENGPEGLFNTAKDRPRSQRSLDVERKYSPSKPDQTTFSGTEVSPRRTKNPLYKDSEEVNTKRREASKERQKEYNDFLKQKAEERRRQDDMRHQQQQSTKPTEIVKNPFYSSDDYEKFQREIQRKQGEDYRNFLAKDEEARRETRQNYNQEPPRTTYGSSFKHPPPSPKRIYHQTPPSPVPRLRDQTSVQEMQQNPSQVQNGYSEQNYIPNVPPQQEYMVELQQRQENQYPFPSNASDHGDYRMKLKEYPGESMTGSYQHQMTAPYPKASSAPPEHTSLPATPSKLSLPVGQYDDMRPFIVKQRNKEYNSLKDKLGPAHLKRPKTPETTALSLPVGQYDEMRPVFEKSRNEEYRRYLERLPPLKKTGMTPQATSLSLPVGQYDKARPLFERQRNEEYNELIQTGRIGKRTIRQKAPTPPDQQGLPIGQQHYEPMHKAMEHQRNKEYNEFLQKKYGNKNLRTTRSEPERVGSDAGKASFYYGNEVEHLEKRKQLDEERKNEYNQFIKELDPPPSKSMDIPSDVDSGLPIGQQHHEAWKKFLRSQRNKEYNQFVDLKNTEVRNRDWNFEQNGVLELRGDDAVQSKQRELKAERQREYNNYMSQQRVSNPSRRHEFVDTASGPYGGLFHGLGEHGNRTEILNRERQQEYNDKLDQQYGKDRPSGRPNWVKESLPNDVDRGRSPMKAQPPPDQYQQMLDEKRREEASRRRYEDPEYQDRLAQGRDRGEAGQRYGY